MDTLCWDNLVTVSSFFNIEYAIPALDRIVQKKKQFIGSNNKK